MHICDQQYFADIVVAWFPTHFKMYPHTHTHPTVDKSTMQYDSTWVNINSWHESWGRWNHSRDKTFQDRDNMSPTGSCKKNFVLTSAKGALSPMFIFYISSMMSTCLVWLIFPHGGLPTPGNAHPLPQATVRGLFLIRKWPGQILLRSCFFSKASRFVFKMSLHCKKTKTKTTNIKYFLKMWHDKQWTSWLPIFKWQPS